MPGDFEFRNLDSSVRRQMLAEIDDDVRDGVLYLSTSFSDAGKAAYPNLLREAAEKFDESWLGGQLAGSFIDTDASGKSVRRDQHTFFSQCEFNHFYVRAICRFATENGGYQVRIYRARASSKPRPGSEAKLGQVIDHEAVLRDLRQRIGTPPQFGIPDVASGLSVELVCHGTVP